MTIWVFWSGLVSMNKNLEGTNLEVVTTQIVRLGLYRYTKSRSHVWSSISHQSKRTLRASSLVEKNPNLKSSKKALLIHLVQNSQIPSISHSWFISQVEPSKPKVEQANPKWNQANPKWNRPNPKWYQQMTACPT